jgi:hypothetical protein
MSLRDCSCCSFQNSFEGWKDVQPPLAAGESGFD